MHTLIKDYLNYLKQRVFINGKESDVCSVVYINYIDIDLKMLSLFVKCVDEILLS